MTPALGTTAPLFTCLAPLDLWLADFSLSGHMHEYDAAMADLVFWERLLETDPCVAEWAPTQGSVPGVRTCRVCGCTDIDCRICIERTGQPCHWVDADLCSACAVAAEAAPTRRQP